MEECSATVSKMIGCGYMTVCLSNYFSSSTPEIEDVASELQEVYETMIGIIEYWLKNQYDFLLTKDQLESARQDLETFAYFISSTVYSRCEYHQDLTSDSWFILTLLFLYLSR